MKYNTANNLAGWFVFAVAMITYGLTISPTASFWDCGEFIATANELEVPHPPGAPLFLMLGRFFAMFAPDVTQVALMINWVSALSSAAMAMLICWTVTILAKKALAPNDENPDATTGLSILAAGVVGGLSCVFLDTVWFNAVEAEVYALSSFFTCLVFWLMLKWEARADEPDHLKWIVFIAFMMGLGVGVHLLNLLTIPALVLVYYFRKFTYSPRGLALAFVIGVAILGFLQVGVIQKTWDLAWAVERFFVGSIDLRTGKDEGGLGLPFGLGAMSFAIVLVGGLIAGICYTQKKQLVAWNVLLVCTLMVYIGFSSYATILIRSGVDPPIDQNHPATLNSFLSYVKREQYGDKPLFKGQMYNTQITGTEKVEPFYTTLKEKNVYVHDGDKMKYTYDPKGLRYFPRMSDPDHYASGPHGYKNYVSDKNKGADPNNPSDDTPSGIDNLKFFFGYQVGHMYWRYFLWNFVGRESDIQHAGWESGLNVAELRNMPDDMRHNKTRNHYFYLPLILGLIGLGWHLVVDGRRAGIVALLFFFTGLAIVIYLNQVAQEPRERDYAFVGSYHTFVIWVGLGVAALADGLRKRLGKATPYAVLAVGLVVPGIMAAQNWDDHDRSGQYVAPDSAYNLLNSCAQNAILFTNGDNDTFPLWYLQEVEGVRTDVRVVNLSLLNTDWYIYQLKHKQWNTSEPLPIRLKDDFFLGERNSVVSWRPQTFRIPTPVEQIKANAAVGEALLAQVDSSIDVRVAGRGGQQNPYLMKQDLIMLDMILNNAEQGWPRPIYFANTVASSNFVGTGDYLSLEGMAYRLTPVKAAGERAAFGVGRVDLDKMYENLKTFRLRGLDNPNLFFGENIEKMVSNTRSSYYRLTMGLLDGADRINDQLAAPGSKLTTAEREVLKAKAADYEAKALETIEFARKNITDEAVPLGAANRYLYAMIYDRLQKPEQTAQLLEAARRESIARLRYYKSAGASSEEENDYYFVLQRGLEFSMAKGDSALATAFAGDLYEMTSDARYQDLMNQWKGAAPAPAPLPAPAP